MNAAVSVMNHPTDETLAAFVDAKLSAAARQDVVKHMAECAECRDVVLMTTEFNSVEAPAAGNVSRPAFGWKKIVTLVAAAAIAVVFAVPLLRTDSMEEVVKTAMTLEERPNEARLSVDLPYQRAKVRTRGAAKVGSLETQIAAGAAADRAAKNPTVENLHAAGVAYMYYGKHDRAVEMLERALTTSKTPSAALLNDLTAAYLGTGQFDEALAVANRSLSIEQTPVALWNRALALKWTHRDAEARAAWEQYLLIDPNSPWAEEVRRDHLTGY